MTINYNKSFSCTYKKFNDDYDSNLCYQIQLLQAFNMNKYDEYILQKNIENLFIFLRDNTDIINICNLLKNKYTNLSFLNNKSHDLENLIYFQILFSYDYFDFFHKELINYFKETHNFQEIYNYILREK
tara:strand:- start:37548 stop:37934 length:387 start_codon:yes stop_codon:yes gene_type:complete